MRDTSDAGCRAPSAPQAFRATAFLDVLYPTRCAGCELPGALLCDACRARLALIDPARACPRCGAPEAPVYCGECDGLEPRFSTARCAGVYEGPLARAVALHKDAGELRLSEVLSALAVAAAPEWAAWADAVTFAPASPVAHARRGFDHGARLGAAVAAALGVPGLDLLRTGARLDQRGLSRERRAANAAGSVSVPARVRVPGRVILVDDVLTTCATADAAAAALLGAGAREVRVLAVARACTY